jgi:PhzF family phenazine biosynthesis protein
MHDPMPRRARAFKTVDVFTSTPLLGNPVAVVLDGDSLTTAQMQRVARWTNLSETTFLLPPTTPEASYRLRIFTPGSELPFAGHPTLGSAFAALEAGRVTARHGRLVQECASGLIPVEVQEDALGLRLALTMPAPTITLLSPADTHELEMVLGRPVRREYAPAIVDVGAVWLVAELSSPQALLELSPDLARSAGLERRLGLTGVSVYARYPGGQDIEVRSFAPSCGINEDPVCGSGNGAVAFYRHSSGALPDELVTYRSTQGRRVGRDGQVAITVSQDGRVTVGGACVTCVDGTITI